MHPRIRAILLALPLALALALPGASLAAKKDAAPREKPAEEAVVKSDPNQRIDPDYSCAEYVALALTESEGPVFQALQIDGFVSAELGTTWVDPDIVKAMMQNVFLVCQEKDHLSNPAAFEWENIKKNVADPPERPWDADVTTCAQYAEDPDNGSGFLIWLDAYNRRYNATDRTILDSDADIQACIAACASRPNDRVLDVLKDVAVAPKRKPAAGGKKKK